jgi:hypothetical protein
LYPVTGAATVAPGAAQLPVVPPTGTQVMMVFAGGTKTLVTLNRSCQELAVLTVV